MIQTKFVGANPFLFMQPPPPLAKPIKHGEYTKLFAMLEKSEKVRCTDMDFQKVRRAMRNFAKRKVNMIVRSRKLGCAFTVWMESR